MLSTDIIFVLMQKLTANGAQAVASQKSYNGWSAKFHSSQVSFYSLIILV